MTAWAPSPLRRVIGAPFMRRTWSELGHTLVLAVLAFLNEG